MLRFWHVYNVRNVLEVSDFRSLFTVLLRLVTFSDFMKLSDTKMILI
jgi:hypothetical protein